MTPRSRSAATLALAFVVASVLIWLSTAQAEPAAGGPYIDVYCPAGEPCPGGTAVEPFETTGFRQNELVAAYGYWPGQVPCDQNGTTFPCPAGGAPAAIPESAIAAGVEEWSTVPSAHDAAYALLPAAPSGSVCGGTVGGLDTLQRNTDGQNTVMWAPLEGSVIGLACWWSGTNECDIILDNTWAGAGSPENVRTVLLHEVGHCQGLGHSSVPGAVMLPTFTGPQGLHPDDVAGYCAVYGCGQPPTVTPTAVPTATPLPAPRCGLRAWPGGLGGCQLLPGIARD